MLKTKIPQLDRLVTSMQPEFKGNLTHAAVHQLHEKQGARPKQKKQQKERGGPDNQKCTKRETCFNIVEQSLHIQEVNALQRKQSASNVEKTDIMALFASPKAQEGVLMSYKPSLLTHP